MKISREGEFVRIDLPYPGRWVIVMRPHTAMILHDVLAKMEVGKHPIDGDVVVVVHSAGNDMFALQFPPWPGIIHTNTEDIRGLCETLRASTYSYEVTIKSSGAEIPLGG